MQGVSFLIIGVPKEIKNNEFRVPIILDGVYSLKNDGNRILVQKNAGRGSGYSNRQYKEAEAEILDKIEEVYNLSKMIVKVKEPIELEYKLIKKYHIIFTYLHLSLF